MAETTIKGAMEKRNGGSPAEVDTGGAVLALRDDQQWWTSRQLAALKSLGIKHASQEDLLVFLHYCAKTKLDPFSKQIYLIERRSWNKDEKRWDYTQTIQTGIDGYRVVAQRAAARDHVQIEYEQTVWFDAEEKPHEIWLRPEPPAGALVVVLKHLPDGRIMRYPGIARFDSYADFGKDKDSGERYLKSQWKVMPDHMIEKCAEAFGLRRAFPNDLGGVYVEDEMRQQDQEYHEQPPKLSTRQRAVEPDDDGVVPGTVDADVVDDGTVPPETPGEPAGAAETAEPSRSTTDATDAAKRKELMASIKATFRDAKIDLRSNLPRAIVNAALRAHSFEPPANNQEVPLPQLVLVDSKLAELSAEHEPGDDLHEALVAYAAEELK